MARKVIVWLAALFIVANLTIVLLVIFGGKSTPPPKLPNPNGYDDFKRAASLISGKPEDYAKLERDDLAKLVATNQPALKAVRLGLTHESRVPVKFTPEYGNTLGSDFPGFKQLVLLFAAESRLAELEGRTNEAARIAVEGIRFSEETARGGLLMHRMVAAACEAILAARLESPSSTPDASTCREVIGELQKIDDAEEAIATTTQREEQFGKTSNGLKGRLSYMFTQKMMQPAITNSVGKANAATARRRALMARLAARAYLLEKNKRAENWNDLVPAYLKEIPKYPDTGANLVFPQL